MASPLDNLEPRLVWKHFDAIRQIPRPSKHEERVAAHVVAWGRRAVSCRRDAVGNIVVKVPATHGHEAAPTIVLQGHLDMVPEKNSDVQFDFLADPIQVRIVGEYVYATGTTLGADNGIGVASAMAVAEDPEGVHGPLELLFTIDEETGLTGAMGIDPALLQGRTMINLDTEEDAALYIGCAGGADALAIHVGPGRREQDRTCPDLGPWSAGRPLRSRHPREPRQRPQVPRPRPGGTRRPAWTSVVSFAGGSKHNAIPRESDALVRVPHERGRAARGRRRGRGVLKEEFGEIDPGQRFEGRGRRHDDSRMVWSPRPRPDPGRVPGLPARRPGHEPRRPWPGRDLEQPRGGGGRGRRAPGDDVQPLLGDAVAGDHRAGCGGLHPRRCRRRDPRRLPGMEAQSGVAHPQASIEVFEREFGDKPHVRAIHAGLECGLIGEKFPGMDMVSMGPQIESPHSPDERVKIDTVERFYRLLKATLASVA